MSIDDSVRLEELESAANIALAGYIVPASQQQRAAITAVKIQQLTSDEFSNIMSGFMKDEEIISVTTAYCPDGHMRSALMAA